MVGLDFLHLHTPPLQPSVDAACVALTQLLFFASKLCRPEHTAAPTLEGSLEESSVAVVFLNIVGHAAAPQSLNNATQASSPTHHSSEDCALSLLLCFLIRLQRICDLAHLRIFLESVPVC